MSGQCRRNPVGRESPQISKKTTIERSLAEQEEGYEYSGSSDLREGIF
jgi:hypothetical protein